MNTEAVEFGKKSIDEIKRIIKAAILSAQEPLSLQQLSRLFEEEEGVSLEELRIALKALEEDFQSQEIELKEVATGYRFQVKMEMMPRLMRLAEERPAKYSRAFLETLALIAYKQPITRAEIEDIRGVSVSTPTLRTLLEREWVKIIGHREVPGRPALYATTKQFLDYFNLRQLSEMPALLEVGENLYAQPTLEESNPL